jgi:putative membrane protein
MRALTQWIVTALLFLVIGHLGIGVGIESFASALFAALLFGLLNLLVKPLLVILTLPLTVLTFGIFYFVINALIFALAAALVPGFHLQNGFLTALAGSLCLSFLQLMVQVVFQR